MPSSVGPVVTPARERTSLWHQAECPQGTRVSLWHQLGCPGGTGVSPWHWGVPVAQVSPCHQGLPMAQGCLGGTRVSPRHQGVPMAQGCSRSTGVSPRQLTHEAVGQADGLRGHGRLVAHDVGGHHDGLAHVGGDDAGGPRARRQPRIRHVVGAGGRLPALREQPLRRAPGAGTHVFARVFTRVHVCMCLCTLHASTRVLPSPHAPIPGAPADPSLGPAGGQQRGGCCGCSLCHGCYLGSGC